MEKFLNFFNRCQEFPKEIELEYTRLDEDTFQVNNGQSIISIRVVTISKDREIETTKEAISSKGLTLANL